MASWIVDNSEKRSGTGSISSSNGIPTLNETYEFIIESDSKFTSRIEILYQTPLFPIVNRTVSAYGLAVCKATDATRRDGNPFLWDASATFSSEVEEGQDPASGGDDPQSDPTVWVPVYETKQERLQETSTKDRAGVVIANSAGQAFQNGINLGRFIPVWEFYQIEASTITDEQIVDRNETVNSEEFRGRAIDSLLLTVMNSKVGFYYGQRRRLTQYSLKYNKRLWTEKRLDVGNLWKKQGSNDLIDPNEDNPRAIQIGLDGSGRPAGGYDGATNKPSLTITAPSVLSFDRYDELDFNLFLRV